MRKDRDWRDAVMVFAFLMVVWVLVMAVLFVYFLTDGGAS